MGLVGVDPRFILSMTKETAKTLDNIVITIPRAAKTASTASKVAKIGRTLLDFVPFAGGIADVYEGARDGDLAQVGMGVLTLAFDIFTLGGSSIAKGAAKTLAKEGAEIIAKDLAEQALKKQIKQESVKTLRQKAVRDAWKEEKALVRETGQGTREWTEKEAKELLEKGKVKGYQGHHINNVKHHPQHAGNPNNIKFVTPREHLLEHGGNFKNKSTGEFINRKID
jgi:hypothetical protein